MKPGGLLIINADDWGLDAPTTEAIRRCFVAGAVTSASAMAFMAGSEGAARVAADLEIPVGLHINLTEPFTAVDLDEEVRARQARTAAYFGGPGWRRWGVSRALFPEIEICIAEQLTEFRRLYGREPTHFDGHEHIHQSFGVLAAKAFPRDAKMRPSLTFMPNEKWWPNRAVRAVVNRTMRARFSTPRYLFSIRDMHPQFGGRALEEKLALASGAAVEVMTHPGWDDEREVLLDAGWLELISLRPTGSYEQLEPHRRRAWWR
jgi:predicted glycoside hydrolase/deacetylase ChbG (UPF0249 family)